jgi:thiol:disulfide interchange protein
MQRKAIAGFLFIMLSGFAMQAQMKDPVHWKFETKSIGAGEYELVFTATIDQPWHMYGMYIPANGPIATTIHFNDAGKVEFLGKPIEEIKPVEKFDPNFNMKIGLHSGQAIFKQKVKMGGAGQVSLSGTVEYQSCNDKECLLPVEREFSLVLGEAGVAETTATGLTNASKTLDIGISSDTSLKAGDGNTAMYGTGKDISKEKSSDKKSLWSFFWLSFIFGLGAILTPCVFPMIPMTVSFFMRGEQDRKKGIINGLVFGLSIILIYTSIGVIVSLTSAGSDFANQLSTHWIPNLIFFLLFIVFAASFLGMFELILPASLVNKADARADKGGYAAAFFMALTLVIVSFSCTGPLVGAILVEAASGMVLKPTIGMFGFSFAFALPFVIFAMFPSLLKNMPKSGGWLNTVKVVFGFVLLAFGMKFLSNIDQAYHLGILGREVYLSVWIVIFSLLGLYLLGKIKFAHDSDLQHLGVPRLFLAMASFALVVYMIPGMFGAPLKGLSALIPPKTGHSFDLVSLLRESQGAQPVSKNSTGNELCGTPKYSDFLELPYGLHGYFDLQEGLSCAKQMNKPVFLDLKGHTCTNCKAMEAEVWSDPEVLQRLKSDFVIIALYTDDKFQLPENEWVTSSFDGKVKKTIGKKNADYLAATFGTNSIPLYTILDTTGKVLVDPVGYSPDTKKFIDFLDLGKARFYNK